MNKNKNYLLLDVRSPGEYGDTSQYAHMNMGRIKGAVNISIDSFSQHLPDLKKYSDKNIFVYCSHSQRSRRVSKLLSDNGFKNVYNINGGMSVVNESNAQSFPLKSSVFENGKPYRDIAPTDAFDMMQKKEMVIIDVRSNDEFNSKDSAFIHNLGHVRNAINIPSAKFKEMFKTLGIPGERTILVTDLDGSKSADIALEMARMGYTHVYNLFEGLEGFMCDNYLTPVMKEKLLVNLPPFHVISIRESIDLLARPNNFLIIDARPAEEFNNRASREYLNNGHLKNAVNVPSVDALIPVVDNLKKDAPILVYGSYSGNIDADICKALVEKGYRNVYFLYQSIGRFTWACFNIENCKDGLSLLTDHKGLY